MNHLIPTIAIRLARATDARDLELLAALDSSLPLEGEILLATVDGAPRAALQLSDGRAVADPFVRSAELVALLRVRAQALAGPKAVRRRAVAAPVPPLALAP